MSQLLDEQLDAPRRRELDLLEGRLTRLLARRDRMRAACMDRDEIELVNDEIKAVDARIVQLIADQPESASETPC